MVDFTPEQEQLLKYVEDKQKAQPQPESTPPNTDLQKKVLGSVFGRAGLAMRVNGGVARNFASGVTRGASDRGLAKVGGTTFEQERQKTLQAQTDQPIAANTADIVGTTLPMLAAPMPSSLAGAAALGGGIGLADNAAKAGVRGELPSPTEAAISTVAGTGGGLVGHFMGKAVEDLLNHFGAGDLPLSEVAQKAIRQRAVVEDIAGAKMRSSGVIIGSDAIDRLNQDVMTKLTDEGFSRQSSKSLYPAVKMLQQQAAKGEDISLEGYNALRQRIRNALPKEASGTEVNWHSLVMDDMNALIETLPKPGVAISGDASAGLQAWRDMNVSTMDKRRGQILAGMFYRAELRASQGGKGVDLGQAMQDEAYTFLTAEGKSAEKARSLFQGEDKKALEGLVKGTPGTAFNNLQERYLGQNILAIPARIPIRVGTMAAEKLTGGGEAATRALGMNLLESTGKNVEALGGGNIPRATANLTAAGAETASRIGQQYNDRQAKINMMLDAERAKAMLMKQQPIVSGFPKNNKTPPVTP